MPARRPQLAELGLFLLVVALPLVFTPFSTSPFGDPKLVVVVVGSLALWLSGLPLDRRIGGLAALWTIATVITAVAGVEPIRSLAARTEGEGGGAILVLVCAVLVTAGAGIDEDLRERGRRWLVASAGIVGGIGIVVRLWPELLQDRIGLGTLGFVGSTMGNQVFAAAFMAAGIAAALTPARRSRKHLLIVGFLAIGTATFGERSSLVLPVVAVAFTLWKANLGWRRSFALASTVVVILVGWQVVEPSLSERPAQVGSALAPLQGQATDIDRQVVWRVTLGAASERPIIGWGPGATQAAYLSRATPDDIEEATRRWGDAHNLFLESAVTSGLLGLFPLVLMFAVVGKRAWLAQPSRAWPVGSAAALGAYSMVEPLNLVLTPLLFLFAGMAAGHRAPERAASHAAPERAPAGVRVGVAIALGLATVVSLTMITGAALERWGRTYGEQWALRMALRVQPWRLSATEHLSLQMALDGRAGDEPAGIEAARLIAEGVDRFPWDVNARLWAADVDTLLDDPTGAEAWRLQHVERFPADALLLSGDVEDGFDLPVDEPATGP